MKSAGTITALLVCLWLLPGCRRDMFNQPKANPLRASKFFPDGASARPLPAHVVSRENWQPDDSFATGMIGTNPVAAFPFPITRAVLERGKQRYEIYCVPCHGQAGDGEGAVVRRGFAASPPLTIDRLRNAPPGHFVDVIVRGYGVMYPQAVQVTPADRWAIAAYIRALQLSQHALLAKLPPADAAKLKAIP
jgi:mono/diheme cytochrome c family protein